MGGGGALGLFRSFLGRQLNRGIREDITRAELQRILNRLIRRDTKDLGLGIKVRLHFYDDLIHLIEHTLRDMP